jgi:hypothetical protein
LAFSVKGQFGEYVHTNLGRGLIDHNGLKNGKYTMKKAILKKPNNVLLLIELIVGL